MLLALACDGREHELVGLLVEQEHRRRLRAEDRAGDLDDRMEQSPELLLGREHAGGHRRREPVVAVGHALAPPTFDAIRYMTLFS